MFQPGNVNAPGALPLRPVDCKTSSMTLSASAISCRRGPRPVLRGISFTLSRGQIMAVTGANGSGKSTLLRLMAGLNDPDGGSLTLNGAPLDRETRQNAMRWIGPDCPLKPSLSVFENLSFWSGMQGDKGGRDAIARALHRMEIAGLADRPVHSLSSGQKRRALLGRLFLGGRELWLLDEPEAALDRDGREMLLRALHEHCGNQGSAIIATHNPDLWQPTFTLPLKPGESGAGHARLNPSDRHQPRPHPLPRAWTVFRAVIR